jgi:1-acyl-sn-glycerol-3-phosphate acyltransferase
MPEIKPQVYKDRRPAADFDRFHDWVRAHRPGWIYSLVRIVVTPLLVFVYRGWALGVHNVPERGPFILAPNHFSNLDHFFCGVYIRRRLQFMGKSQIFGRSRILDYIFRVGGVFPVRRGHRDEEAFVTARSIVGRSGSVCIYCEGGRQRGERLGEPKPGVGRLALETGVPVIPVAIHGSQGVRGWRRLRFPRVTLQYGEPVVFACKKAPTRDEQLAASAEVFARIKEMYAVLEAEGREGARRRLQFDDAGLGERAS